MPSLDLEGLLRGKKIVICCGSGGVGKTTVSAALGVQAALLGKKVLESKETPGLGDKVEIEPHFLANFEALDARLNEERTALANPIVTVKQGEKTEPWQIDGITGATITSETIGVIMDKGASEWVPLLEREGRSFEYEPPADASAEEG